MATDKTYDSAALQAHRRQRANIKRLKHLGLHAMLIALLAVMLYPVIWMVLSSLRPER